MQTMFREMSQQLNFAATVSVLAMALFVLTVASGQAGGQSSGESFAIAAPVRH
ncbi:hypothetical protein WAB17_08815 [Parerythrobacter aurantius]|uniref:hypothetical protein n=1 Tax=Parerythrobacter aurantius TaxID=3127706 RepID=UPI0032491696